MAYRASKTMECMKEAVMFSILMMFGAIFIVLAVIDKIESAIRHRRR